MGASVNGRARFGGCRGAGQVGTLQHDEAAAGTYPHIRLHRRARRQTLHHQVRREFGGTGRPAQTMPFQAGFVPKARYCQSL